MIRVIADPAPLNIVTDTEEASYLLWILLNGLPDNPHNRIMKDHC